MAETLHARIDDYDLAYEIAYEVKDPIDEALQIRVLRNAIMVNDLEHQHRWLYDGFLEKTEYWITTNLRAANKTAELFEDDWDVENECALIDSSDWTDAETRLYAGCSLEEWRAMNEEDRGHAIQDYGSSFDFIKGVRNTFPFHKAHYEGSLVLKKPEFLVPLMDIDKFLGKDLAA